MKQLVGFESTTFKISNVTSFCCYEVQNQMSDILTIFSLGNSFSCTNPIKNLVNRARISSLIIFIITRNRPNIYSTIRLLSITYNTYPKTSRFHRANNFKYTFEFVAFHKKFVLVICNVFRPNSSYNIKHVVYYKHADSLL